MNKKQTIKQIAKHVRQQMEREGTGHDWWHVERVWKAAKHIASNEKADLFVVELGALLHDLYDWKFHGHNYKKTNQKIRKLLEQFKIDSKTIAHIEHIMAEVSFKGAGVKNKMKTLEGKIVQDADRLDALGAIGIARTFAYGGSKNRPIYDPTAKPGFPKTFAQYRKGESSSLHHFHEKLLLLKDRMNTKTAKKLAKRRHEFMQQYLKHFHTDWSGKF